MGKRFKTAVDRPSYWLGVGLGLVGGVGLAWKDSRWLCAYAAAGVIVLALAGARLICREGGR